MISALACVSVMKEASGCKKLQAATQDQQRVRPGSSPMYVVYVTETDPPALDVTAFQTLEC
jgi:hypothetical protein